MANIKQTLDELMTLDGAMCAAVVDSASGMMLGSAGSGVDLEVAAAGNTEVIRSKMKTMRSLDLNDVIEDIPDHAGQAVPSCVRRPARTACSSTSCSTSSAPIWRMARRKVLDVDKEMNF